MNKDNTITIGMDLGDKFHIAAVFDEKGNEVNIAKIMNTKTNISKFFNAYKGATVAMEAGTHSPWISRMLDQMDINVLVGNPRKLRFIWDCHDKSDQKDARVLGMVCRIEPRMLHPLRHRGSQAQADLAVMKSRDILVRSRTQLINHTRGLVKTNGDRLPTCSADSFARRCATLIPSNLKPALECVFETISRITEQIHELDHKISVLSSERYPETGRLRQVPGVGPITALAYVLTIEDPKLFNKNRQVGPYLGLTPRLDKSGQSDKQLKITKAGNKHLRQLLVGCAHYILGPFGPDSHLRRHGQKICVRGGKNAKKRAAVAVARKLSVLLHRLWVSGEKYEPFYNGRQKDRVARKPAQLGHALRRVNEGPFSGMTQLS